MDEWKVIVLTGSYLSQKFFEEKEQIFSYQDDVLALADFIINKPFYMENVLSEISKLIEER